MVTYTVGFGVETTLDPSTLAPHPQRGYAPNCPAETGAALSWPDPAPSSGRIDDLMHAAYNGRGEYFSATQSDELANALISAVNNISQRSTASASAVDFNSGSVRAGSQVYQASFQSEEWTGQVLALGLHDGSANNGCSVSDPLGTVCPTPEWDAGCTLTGGTCASTGATIASPNLGTGRQILTFNTTTDTGVPLQWSDLSAAQQSDLSLDDADQADANGAARLGYLRGERTNELTNGGIFRDRTSVLGDIIHSSPLYVGVPQRRYPSNWSDNLGGGTPENAGSAQTYSSFKTDYKGRATMVYSGSNDGLLHGFESGTFDSSGNLVAGTNKGKELLAYMPSQVLASARHLTYPSYTHRYYVDGPPVENDVFFEGDDKWHTVLAGGLGSGGQGLYALDITNPSDSSASAPLFDEAEASQLVLWEFTDEDDPDLGYTISNPAIVRLHNGDWGVVVGNGYNNTEADGAASGTGNAVFYVLDIENGNVLAKFDTGVGSAQDPTAQSRPNGLASVFPVDKDGDFITDYVYGGDLFGNVWRFDLTDTNESNWTISEFGTGSAKPLFTAVDGSGNPQSITTKVQVAAHPNGVGHGVMVYFGTGKYLEVGDAAANTSTIQTFYGIWDKDFFGVGTSIDAIGALSSIKKSGFTRTSDLQQQQIDAVEASGNRNFRRVTNNTVDYSAPKHGWYLDLKLSTGSNEGEMVIADPVVRGNGVIFTTFIPSADICNAGNPRGFLMVLNRATGGRLTKSPFDVNADGAFSLADYLSFGDSGNESASGIDVTGGRPGIILSGGKDLALIPKFDGTIEAEEVNLGVPKAGRKSWTQLR
jgi:type IV pilus assembly protein PilY1